MRTLQYKFYFLDRIFDRFYFHGLYTVKCHLRISRTVNIKMKATMLPAYFQWERQIAPGRRWRWKLQSKFPIRRYLFGGFDQGNCNTRIKVGLEKPQTENSNETELFKTRLRILTGVHRQILFFSFSFWKGGGQGQLVHASTMYKVLATSHQNRFHVWPYEKKSPSIFCLLESDSSGSYLFNVVNTSIKLSVDLAWFLHFNPISFRGNNRPIF